MIETECYAELNEIFSPTGDLVNDLRLDCAPGEDAKIRNRPKGGFFSRLFRKKVSKHSLAKGPVYF